ncbi:nitrate reductase cytochrome c-type subunit [Shewanella corallii]|uniref:Periplasmic nitrate reductase, electron transfer subunit n=1 Tax=Shewanella corallii TaxID=560080 RepID=A0ABT0N3V2_9GAMM|nr:nitrate reductase cytochrome c-type subunit [Shewanella corallii]MCL2912457.1 nitrate reductase cytochrome c-type subunit [Shewanella corallii]
MKKLVCVAMLALGLSACSGQAPLPDAQPVNVKSLAGDSKISEVRPADVMPEYPNRGKSVERTFADQPPLVPHKDYAINIKKNTCINCHSPAKAKRMRTTSVPASHLEADGQTLKGENYFCTQCHVPQASNKQAIVDNSF